MDTKATYQELLRDLAAMYAKCAKSANVDDATFYIRQDDETESDAALKKLFNAVKSME